MSQPSMWAGQMHLCIHASLHVCMLYSHQTSIPHFPLSLFQYWDMGDQAQRLISLNKQSFNEYLVRHLYP
jgi:hypothetical protein